MTTQIPDVILKNRAMRLITELGPDKTFLIRAEITEGLSTVTDIDIQFLTNDINIDISKIVGRRVTIEMDRTVNDPKAKGANAKVRFFHGWCIDCGYEDTMGGLALFRAELRPWFWLLTLGRQSRIFQNKTVIDIIKEVLKPYGYSGDIETPTRGTYPKREYTVQYRESDFDFVSRLMEENGIYWYTKDDQAKQKIVFADDVQGHQPLTDAATIEFMEPEENFRRTSNHIYEWSDGEVVTRGKVTLREYDFEKQKVVTTVVSDPKGSHPHKGYEDYEWPGSFDPEKPDDDGKRIARIRHEANAAVHRRSKGIGNVPTMTVGGKFTLKNHDRKNANSEYVVVKARHFLQLEVDEDRKGQAASVLDVLKNPHDIVERYRHEIVVQPASVPFRAPQTTHWPEIAGVQTAVVCGKKNEEIYTDEFGRVKVMFHWDRQGKGDENSTCFIRYAVPWGGTGWGWQGIPRIGQEVVVSFEDGDPDKPLITGMLYNGIRKPSEAPPGKMNMSGIRTNSTKGGNGYHELMFDDTKDAEKVRFQSEKDYDSVIKNNATFSVGFEKAKPGNYTEKIKNNMTTTIASGDHTFTVSSGKQTISVKKDRALNVEGDEIVKVKGDKTDTITKDYTIDVGPNLTIKAKQKIVIQCGGSKIEMTPQKITVTAMQIEQKGSMTYKAEGGMSMELKGGMSWKAEGGMQAELKGGMMLKAEGGMMAQVKGGMMLQLQGGMMAQLKAGFVFIN